MVTVAHSASGHVPGPLLLWSTNSWLKFYIQMKFRRNKHYVWCSPLFDAGSAGKYTIGSGQPPSSDPATIYRQLHTAVSKQDEHDQKISSQKVTLKALATEWLNTDEISQDEHDEILAILDRASIRDWRPLLFVIPYSNVCGKVDSVPRNLRASIEPEYIIHELEQGEFDVIEPIPCS